MGISNAYLKSSRVDRMYIMLPVGSLCFLHLVVEVRMACGYVGRGKSVWGVGGVDLVLRG